MWYPDIKLTRTFRLAFMITLITSFFIVAPIIILYTAGYRYDFTHFQIKKTGVIAIDVEPTDARIYLNDVEINKSVPLRLTNRAPGSYSIAIQKDGYLPWKNTAHVESTQTTYATDIYLFLDVLPTFEYAPQNGIFSSYSQDGQFVASVIKPDADTAVYEVQLYNMDTEEETLLWRSDGDTEPRLEWSLHAPLLAILSQDNGTSTIKSIDVTNPTATETYTVQETGKTQWHEGGKNILYVQNADQIRSLSSGNNIIVGTVTSSVWFVDSDADIWSIENQNTIWKNEAVVSTQLENSSITDIIDSRATHLVARNENSIQLVWFDGGDTTVLPTTHIFPRTYGKSWSTWILWSEWEVLELVESGDVTLLTRTNQPLRDVSASTKHESLLFAFDHSITAFHPHYRTTDVLFKGDNPIKNIATSEDGDYIIFDTSINEKVGTYKREL